MCCAFSLGFDSLSSAATSVGAKPNHGFFHCQHPGGIFLRLRLGFGRLRARRRPPSHACVDQRRTARARSRWQESAFFQGFRVRTRARHAMRDWIAGHPHAPGARPCRRTRRRFRQSRAMPDFRHRTRPNARKCASKNTPRRVPGDAQAAPATRIDRHDRIGKRMRACRHDGGDASGDRVEIAAPMAHARCAACLVQAPAARVPAALADRCDRRARTRKANRPHEAAGCSAMAAPVAEAVQCSSSSSNSAYSSGPSMSLSWSGSESSTTKIQPSP